VLFDKKGENNSSIMAEMLERLEQRMLKYHSVDKLELKMTDMVNRLLLEQEERMRQMDDIKYQIDIKDKMLLEKTKYEREEMRDRYAAMDSVVKAEFQRKDEAIMGLQ
jgi:hypothetical protein